MKNIKLILTVFATVVMMSAAFAQAPQKTAKRGDKMMAMMTEQLDLTEDQIIRITAIQQEYREKMQALRGQNSNPDREAMRAEMERVKTEQDLAVKSVLSEDQIAKWEILKAERVANRPTNRSQMERPRGPQTVNGKDSANRAGKLQAALDLSDEQAAALKALKKTYHADLEALQTDGTKRKNKKVTKRYHAEIQKILTPEQYEKWTAMRAEKKARKGIK